MTEVTLKALIRERDGHKCLDCGKPQEECRRKLEVHRLVPGAPYSFDDCVTLCRACHRKRHRRQGRPRVKLRVMVSFEVKQGLAFAALCARMSQSDFATAILRKALANEIQDARKYLPSF